MNEDLPFPPAPTPQPNLDISKNKIKKNAPNSSRAKKSLGWLEEAYNTARGENSLWVAVITQAMQDALSRCKKPESLYHKHEATNWLTNNSKDFIDVCLSANLNPDYVRRKAKQVLAAPSPWRAEAGTGKRYLERKEYRARQRQLQKETAATTQTVINGPWLTQPPSTSKE